MRRSDIEVRHDIDVATTMSQMAHRTAAAPLTAMDLEGPGHHHNRVNDQDASDSSDEEEFVRPRVRRRVASRFIDDEATDGSSETTCADEPVN